MSPFPVELVHLILVQDEFHAEPLLRILENASFADPTPEETECGLDDFAGCFDRYFRGHQIRLEEIDENLTRYERRWEGQDDCQTPFWLKRRQSEAHEDAFSQ